MPTYRDDLPIDDAIRAVFVEADPAGIRKLLTESCGALPERVQLAVVLLSDGHVDTLRHYAREAARDSRDVLYWAFYYDDEPPARLRQLLKPDPG